MTRIPRVLLGTDARKNCDCELDFTALKLILKAFASRFTLPVPALL